MEARQSRLGMHDALLGRGVFLLKLHVSASMSFNKSKIKKNKQKVKAKRAFNFS
jgi:hypothetical protein